MQAILESQYNAALAMMRHAILASPEAAWNDASHGNRTWRIAYHALFYADLYLAASEESYVGWPHTIPDARYLAVPIGEAHNTREQLAAYADAIAGRVREAIAALPMDGPSGFDWLPFSRLELHIYNIRHLQHHTGQLIERLRGGGGGSGVTWVGHGGKLKPTTT